MTFHLFITPWKNWIVTSGSWNQTSAFCLSAGVERQQNQWRPWCFSGETTQPHTSKPEWQQIERHQHVGTIGTCVWIIRSKLIQHCCINCFEYICLVAKVCEIIVCNVMWGIFRKSMVKLFLNKVNKYKRLFTSAKIDYLPAKNKVHIINAKTFKARKYFCLLDCSIAWIWNG